MRLVLLAATFVLAVPMVALPPVPASAAPTCQGEQATIVGARDGEVTGTDGADVIVTNSAETVHAGAGDDVVCITGTRYSPEIRTGPGDDRVVDTSRAFPDVNLGAGDDYFREFTLRAAYVDTGDQEGLGHDVVIGSRGRDSVVSGRSGEPNDDVVRLGEDGDDLRLRGLPVGTFEAGPGFDDNLIAEDDEARAWAFDRPADTTTVDHSPVEVTGFEHYDLTGLAWSELAFVGSTADESLQVWNGEGPFTARMGGGGDQLEVGAGQSGPFTGGSGHDYLTVVEDSIDLDSTATADLASGRYRVNRAPAVEIAGFDKLEIDNVGSVTVTGDRFGNHLHARACRATIEGGPGKDSIGMDRPRACRHETDSGLRAFGQQGNDSLYGGSGDDRLIGGPGRDYASGWQGQDVCHGELFDMCEVRRLE